MAFSTEDCSPRQREAVLSDAHRLIIVAGPGSGKTRVLVKRVANRIERGINPDRIAVITFTKAVGMEIASRLNTQVRYCGTLHGFAFMILRKFGSRIGYGSKTVIISPESSEALLREKAKALQCKTPVSKLLEMKKEGFPKQIRTKEETVIASLLADLREANIVDYDILLEELDRLLKIPGAKSDIAEMFSELYVDEVQDCSSLDWSIFRNLPMLRKTFVGDSDQAIFRFRGGNVQEMIAESRTVGVTTLYLEDNFRSHWEICLAADHLITFNNSRIFKKCSSMKGLGGNIEVLHASNEGEEVGLVAKSLKVTLEGNPDATVAVIARSNHIVAQFEKQLRAMGFSVGVREENSLPRDWNRVKSNIEYMADPTNDTLATLYMMTHLVPDDISMLKREARVKGKTLNDVFNKYRSGFTAREAIIHLASPSRETLMLLGGIIREIGENAPAALLALNMASKMTAPVDAPASNIRVSTFHSAKGLEFDHVFLVGMEDEVIPGNRKDMSQEDIEEERRLAFVGITRAKQLLTMSYSDTRTETWGRKDIVPHKPSRFILEANP